MNNITITHKGEKIVSVSVNDGDRFVLKDIIEKYASDIYKDMYSSYDKSIDVATYWIEYNGFVFADDKEFVCKCDMDFVLKCVIADRDVVNTSLKYDGMSVQPLTFKCVDANGCSISLNTSFASIFPNIEYSYNNSTWNTWDYSAISLNENDVLYMRGNNDSINYETSTVFFEISGSTELSGNIMTLLGYGTSSIPDVVPPYCFTGLFALCNITKAPELPAKILSDYCYSNMFHGSNITTPPELPAMQLAKKCYFYMFEDCSVLLTAPKLPATTLAESCYEGMFKGCTSLTVAPELPAIYQFDVNIRYCEHEDLVMPAYCYKEMFKYCTSLVKMPELKSPVIGDYSYMDMFNECTSLEETTDIGWCYSGLGGLSGMFYGCSSLEKATFSISNIDANFGNYMIEFFSRNNDPYTTSCVSQIFYDCTSLNEITIKYGRYINTSGTPISYCEDMQFGENGMYTNVPSGGIFKKPTNITHGYIVPTGWTVVNY